MKTETRDPAQRDWVAEAEAARLALAVADANDDTTSRAVQACLRGSVRYMNPATGQTWTGRGMQPAWVRAALASGANLGQFEVKP